MPAGDAAWPRHTYSELSLIHTLTISARDWSLPCTRSRGRNPPTAVKGGSMCETIRMLRFAVLLLLGVSACGSGNNSANNGVCGGAGQTCCPGNSCGASAICRAGVCAHCGGAGEV